jgi:(p)ppGpp synthase/HD superfamily hydrolase
MEQPRWAMSDDGVLSGQSLATSHGVDRGLLRDAIEDQKISPDTIAEQFGGCRRDRSRSYRRHVASKETRKMIQIATAISKSHSANLIKLADKISNVEQRQRWKY